MASGGLESFALDIPPGTLRCSVVPIFWRYGILKLVLLNIANVSQSLPRNVESTRDTEIVDLGSRLTHGLSSTFNKTYGQPYAAASEDFLGDGMLQALSLPFSVHSSDPSLDI